MKRTLVIFLLLAFCSGENTSQEVSDNNTSNYELKLITPNRCDGDGSGCENLYDENSNIGWEDTKYKYCEESSIKFYFEKEFNLDFITVKNFQDDKFKISAKPKAIIVYGPLDESMQYGGYIDIGELAENKELQTVEISEDWPPIKEVQISIQSGYFTPGSVDYCGLQNISFYGYERLND